MSCSRLLDFAARSGDRRQRRCAADHSTLLTRVTTQVRPRRAAHGWCWDAGSGCSCMLLIFGPACCSLHLVGVVFREFADNGARLAWAMMLRQLNHQTTDPMLDALPTHARSAQGCVAAVMHGQPFQGQGRPDPMPTRRERRIRPAPWGCTSLTGVCDGLQSEPPCTPACHPTTHQLPACVTHEHTHGVGEAALGADPPAAGP